MLYLVRQTRERGAKPDFKLLGAMLYYIDAVPERYHHPKEDKYLFALLHARCPQHTLCSIACRPNTGSAPRIRSLAHALTRYENRGDAELDAFATAVEGYADSTGSTCAAKKTKCFRWRDNPDCG